MSITVQQIMKQASSTANEYLTNAVKDIDGRFGDGYALEHPQLIEIYVRAASADYAATLQYQGVEEIASALHELYGALEKLEGLEDLAGAVYALKGAE